MNNISIFCITIISLFCKYNIIRFISNNCNNNIILLPALSGANGGRVSQSIRASGLGSISGKCSQEKAIEHTQIPNHPHLPTTLTHLPHKKAEPPDSASQTIIFVRNSTPLLTPAHSHPPHTSHPSPHKSRSAPKPPPCAKPRQGPHTRTVPPTHPTPPYRFL